MLILDETLHIIKDRRFNIELICSIQSINFLNDLHIYNIL